MYRPHHSTVVAYAALVVALSGSAYAAATVGSAQIVDNSIRSQDVRNNGLGAGDLSPAARASLSGIPPRTKLVSSGGSPAANGDRLRAVLASLGGATANAPWTVRLSPGRFAANTATERFTVPDFVTLVGDGPLTVVETTATSSTVPVVDLTGSNVVRSLTIRNPSTTAGAMGIDGTGATGSLLADLAVTGPAGVVLQASRMRDSTVTTRTEGVRIVPATTPSELDDVRVATAVSSPSVVGVAAGGPVEIDGLDVAVNAVSSAVGLLVTAESGDVEVRNSAITATGVLTSGYGVSLNPPGASTARVYLDSTRLLGNGNGTRNAVRIDGSGAGARISHSLLTGAPEVVEVNPADARCVGNFDGAYVDPITC